MKFSEILSDKGTDLQKLNHKKHVRLQTIHSTELALAGHGRSYAIYTCFGS